MISFEDIDARLEVIGKDRAWLAGATGRSLDAIRSALAPGAKPKSRSELLHRALSKAIEEEESARKATVRLPDQLALAPSAREFDAWCRAYKASKQETLKDWAIAELNKAAEAWAVSKVSQFPAKADAPRFELPFLGAVAAGEQVEAPRDEILPVAKEYPAGHFIVEVNGSSMEPDYPDGSRWVIDGRDKFTPKDQQVCVVSDGSGSSLKRWNRKAKVFESINPAFPAITSGREAKLQGYPVEKLG